MTEKKPKKLEGKFRIIDGPSDATGTGPKRGRGRIDPRTESALRRTMSMARRFAEADLDGNRPVSRVFKTTDCKCVLLGLTCDCDKPCLECQVGRVATGELRFVVDAYLGSKA